MSFVYRYFLARLLAVSISGSTADPLVDQTQMLSSETASDGTIIIAAGNTLQTGNSIESLAIGASANTLRVPTSLHTDFDSRSLDAPAVDLAAGLSEPVGQVQADAFATRVPLMRRVDVTSSVQQRITAAATSRDLLSKQSKEEAETGTPNKHVYQEDPHFTPKAVFADKHLSPDVAEFLGHLAQRELNEKQQVNGDAREAVLISQGTVRAPTSGDRDETDDIEDMQRAAVSVAKTTPLSHFFQHLDTKTTAASWTQRDCTTLSKNVTEKYDKMFGRKSGAAWGTAGPAGAAGLSEIHTGMFFHHWNIGKKHMKVATRKLRLSVLSFLATQDAGKVQLHIWTDLAKQDTRLAEVLGPILQHPELMDSIKITTFDPKIEFGKVPPTTAREVLTERYKKNTMPNLKSDLYRSIILYNYGGIWMDADTVLMRDVAPLLGEDWAHLVKGKEGAIEGALLSASHPQSHFTNEYLISMAMRVPPIDPELEKEKSLLVEIFDSDPAHTTMHVLPPCFFDSDPEPTAANMAVLSSGTFLGSAFFGKVVAEPYREYFSVGIRDAVQDSLSADASVLSDPAFVQPALSEEGNQITEPTSPSWAYHWRGNFAAPWARGSLADVAERTFMKKLQLSKHF